MKDFLDESDIKFITSLSGQISTNKKGSDENKGFVIEQKETIYGYTGEYADEFYIIIDTEHYNYEQYIEYLKERSKEVEYGEDNNYKEPLADLVIAGEIGENMTTVDDGYVVGVKHSTHTEHNGRQSDANFFITEEGARDHLTSNGHNMRSPKIKMMPLYRNHEMKKLYEIIHKLSDVLGGK